MVSIVKWEEGWCGCDTPWDYGWYRGTRDERFTPDVVFTQDEYEEYKDGYNEATRGWDL